MARKVTSNQVQELIHKEDIEYQRMVPYNPESNGKVERGNRVILERARILLYDIQFTFVVLGRNRRLCYSYKFNSEKK